MIDAIVSFYGTDPQVALVLTLGVLFGLSAIGMALHHAYKERKDREDEEQRRRLLEVVHRIPTPFSEKASQGWEKTSALRSQRSRPQVPS